ncbi:J domain-containing protein [Ottowia thiooxydans]|uniref:J domain-containing protein n=1 Tax=Ottowia thiooxydans TaxID=219182 RepID=UPI00048BA0A4|nr:J domain-containing protein [Ottowia thiooxydans]
MNVQPASLDDSPLEPAAPVVTEKPLMIRPGGAPLGPAQKQFNQLLAKIEASKAALIELQRLLTVYIPERARRLQPLSDRAEKLREALVVFLDQRLQSPKGLSKKVQEDMTTILLTLADGMLGDEAVNPLIDEIYERRAPEADDPADEQAAIAEMQDVFSDVFGVEFGDLDHIDSTDEWFDAALDKARKQQEAAEQARAARQSKRKKTAKQQQQEQEGLDADKALREIYRKLASALHPDREPDATERARKSALMAQVNAANDRRDLLALLQLQLQIEQINPQDVSAMADEKLRRFNRVLKEQDQSVRQELEQFQMQIRQGLGLRWAIRSLSAVLRPHCAKRRRT